MTEILLGVMKVLIFLGKKCIVNCIPGMESSTLVAYLKANNCTFARRKIFQLDKVCFLTLFTASCETSSAQHLFIIIQFKCIHETYRISRVKNRLYYLLFERVEKVGWFTYFVYSSSFRLQQKFWLWISKVLFLLK